MSRLGIPEVEITGGQSFQKYLADLCRKVEFGKVVRIVHLQTGLHRAWMTRERPDGCEPIEISVSELRSTIGRVLDDVRDGAVYMVKNERAGRVRGYLYWSAPEWMARLSDRPVTYFYRTQAGRVIRRDLYPLAVHAEPPRGLVRPPHGRTELASA
jgi:hypothetical protein